LKDKLDRVAALTELLSADSCQPGCADRRTGRAMAFGTAFELASTRDKRAWQDGYRYAEIMTGFAG